MSGTGSRRDAGTTLIEALVVVAVIGLAASVGFPRLQQSLASLSWRETIAVVAARLRQVRADALRSGGVAAFVIARDGRGYSAPGGGFVPTPPGVELSPNGRAIGFYSDGSSTGGAVWVSARGRSIPVRVSAATGAISVGGA